MTQVPQTFGAEQFLKLRPLEQPARPDSPAAQARPLPLEEGPLCSGQPTPEALWHLCPLCCSG